MTVICKPSTAIPVAQCGSTKNSHHGEFNFLDTEITCSNGVEVTAAIANTEETEVA